MDGRAQGTVRGVDPSTARHDAASAQPTFMTPLPKRRWSTQRQGKRRAAINLKLPTLIPCPNCKKPTTAHRACAHCGYYKGRKVTR